MYELLVRTSELIMTMQVHFLKDKKKGNSLYYHPPYTHTHTHTHTHSELATAGGSGPLATIISKNVDKAIRLFSMKCDEMVATGREAVQISGPPNHAQLRNISVVNTLHLFHTIINQVIIISWIVCNRYSMRLSKYTGTSTRASCT